MSFRAPYTVSRPGAGSYVNGVWVGAAASTFTILASVQPADGPTRAQTPEGYRSDSTHVLYTDTPLLEAHQATAVLPVARQSDFLTLFGERFDIVKCAPWQNSVIPHYRVLVSRPVG